MVHAALARSDEALAARLTGEHVETRHRPLYEAMRLLVVIHPIPQLLPRLEVRHVLAVEADGLAGLGVPADAGGAVMEGKATEATDLDPFTGGEGLGHLLEHGLDGELDVLRREHALLAHDSFDQLRLGHGFPFVFKRLDHCGAFVCSTLIRL